MNNPEIFDAARLAMNKRRAAPCIGDHDFLHRHAALELIDRLAGIKREFSLAADAGCGHGIFPALAASRFPEMRIICLESAAGLLAQRQGLRVQGREDALPFREGTFDFIVSTLALQLVNDLPGALIQIRRALKPDGLFMAALLGGETLAELREALMLAETEVMGGVSPRVFPASEVRDLGGLLQRAGFALPVADKETLKVTYPDALALMRELRGLGWSNPMTARLRKPMRREMLFRALEIYRDMFSEQNGRVRATFDVIYLSGWAAHESQQKPLKPGSAAQRLADALGTVEHAAGGKTAYAVRKTEEG